MPIKKRILIIGACDTGKSTLVAAITTAGNTSVEFLEVSKKTTVTEHPIDEAARLLSVLSERQPVAVTENTHPFKKYITPKRKRR